MYYPIIVLSNFRKAVMAFKLIIIGYLLAHPDYLQTEILWRLEERNHQQHKLITHFRFSIFSVVRKRRRQCCAGCKALMGPL